MTLDDIPDIEKAYGDEIDRLLLLIQLKEITLCETCDTFFKYTPQKRFCDTCVKERKREYDQRHRQRPEVKERKRELNRKYSREYEKRPEVKERRREYEKRPEVKERRRKRARERYEKNRGKMLEYSREYYKKNREKMLEYHRNYRRRKKGEEE